MEMACVTYQDQYGSIKVKIDYDRCIACGRCVSACKHQARYFVDDIERFFDDLSNGEKISLIVAPAIKTNIPDYKKLLTYLKRLGVNKIYDVSLGADICVWAHIRHMKNNVPAPLITQPCPVIVTYCETYRHDLLNRLSPIHSPMACTSVYMREYEGINDRIAALSPCMAKKNEFMDTGLAHYNITFATLLAYLSDNNIALPDEETPFDHYESGLGSLFPMPGGLKENIEYFMGTKRHIAKAEGFDVFEKLDEYAATPEAYLPDIYDVLNCVDGCNFGSAYSHNRSMFEIDKTMSDTRSLATEERKRKHYESLYKLYDETFNLAHFIREYRPVSLNVPQITESDINSALKLLCKDSYEKQHVDCGACGSNTCYGMARKIALNVNIPENCIVKSKEDAKAQHEENMLAASQVSVLIGDIKTMIDEQKKGNADFAINTDEFYGEYKMLAGNIQDLATFSMKDQLTGLPNRRTFVNRLDWEWKRSARSSDPLSILILDIDKFKTYNDSFGHQQGDVALQMIAGLIKQSLKRQTDFVARWGGEEFVVLLPITPLEGAIIVAERIRLEVERAVIPCANPRGEKATISIGVNTQTPVPYSPTNAFISEADRALYSAKEAGRNRVVSAFDVALTAEEP